MREREREGGVKFQVVGRRSSANLSNLKGLIVTKYSFSSQISYLNKILILQHINYIQIYIN